MGEKEPIEEDRLRKWCESSLSKTYEKREMKTFVNHICASTEEDTTLLHHVNVLRRSGSVKPASICGLLGAPDLPCMCPEGGDFLLERDVKLAINAIKTFAASVSSNLQRFVQLGKGLLTTNKLRIRSQAKLAVTGCTSTDPPVLPRERIRQGPRTDPPMPPRKRIGQKDSRPMDEQSDTDTDPIPPIQKIHQLPHGIWSSTSANPSAEFEYAHSRARKGQDRIRVGRIQCGTLSEPPTEMSAARLLRMAKRHEDLEEVEQKFCNLLDEGRKFSGFVVDVDLSRTEMVISDAKHVGSTEGGAFGIYTDESDDFQKCRDGYHKDPLFPTRQWMQSDENIEVAFNANFYAGQVRERGLCSESFGLVLDKSEIRNLPERNEVKQFEDEKNKEYPDDLLSKNIDRTCTSYKYHCNVKGSAALIVDNAQGLAFVASYPTTKMIEELPCMERVGNEHGSCNGFAGNFIYWNGHPMHVSQLNPDSSKRRVRTVVGVKDGGRRIVILVADEVHRMDIGATLDEMQKLCKLLDLADCINLDGGRSSERRHQRSARGYNEPDYGSAPQMVRDLFIDPSAHLSAHHFGFRYRYGKNEETQNPPLLELE